MDNNSFSFMKEGFDWQQQQAKDMQELDRHDSDEEELKREQEIMRNDDLRDEYRERGLDPRDFYSEVD
jgi:hypothetical protein